MSKLVSALWPLSERTEKQMARLLIAMYTLSELFSPGSEPPWWYQAFSQVLSTAAMPSACCFPQSTWFATAATRFHIHYSLHCYWCTLPHSIYMSKYNNKAITRYTHAHHVPHVERVESCWSISLDLFSSLASSCIFRVLHRTRWHHEQHVSERYVNYV